MSNSPPTPPDDLTPEEVGTLRALIERVGLGPAAERVHSNRETLSRAMAGLSVRRGSILAIRSGLSTLDRWEAT
jgi:hypothetical protein